MRIADFSEMREHENYNRIVFRMTRQQPSDETPRGQLESRKEPLRYGIDYPRVSNVIASNMSCGSCALDGPSPALTPVGKILF